MQNLRLSCRRVRKKLEAQAQQVATLIKEIQEENKIESFSQLEAVDKKRFDAPMQIATNMPIPLATPNNVAFIGVSGAGKSSLINAIAGEKLCEEGITHTTSEMRAWPAPNSNITFFDIPGKNDKISYFSASMMGFLKSCC